MASNSSMKMIAGAFFSASSKALRRLLSDSPANLLMISGPERKQNACSDKNTSFLNLKSIQISCLSSSEIGPGWECGNICLLSHSPYQQLSQGSHQARIKGSQGAQYTYLSWAERYEDGDSRCCGTSGQSRSNTSWTPTGAEISFQHHFSEISFSKR